MTAPWLLSRRVDLAVFGGSFALAMAALAIGSATGDLHGETPSWAWVPAVILCDVAHVWATAFRTYLDPIERRTRSTLLTVVPALGFAASVALYALGELVFWRALAYLAIFHFVRQQYGWVSLYRARARDTSRLGAWIDGSAVYAATLFPLFYWHTHPRRFSWFIAGDVVDANRLAFALPAFTAVYALTLTSYALRAVWRWRRGSPNPGKDLVVVTTAIAWFVGIVVFDSDYAFTVTNVFTHGIPYVALVWMQTRNKTSSVAPLRTTTSRGARSLFAFVGALWLVAFAEEMLWDRAVWHERPWLFGESWDVDELRVVLVPLLALPQLTHYVLDGFIWRRRTNASVAALVA